MDEYELTCKYNVSETCAASISISDLESISDDKSTSPFSNAMKLTYGPIRGSEALRSNLARLYSAKVNSPLSPDNILITPGAIAANFNVFYSLLGEGDHVICQYPTYQQLFSVPASFGAEVSLWRSKEDAKWSVDLEELKSMVKPNTKLIIINNPQNPTGAILPRKQLEDLVDFAKEKDLYVLSDEVYRPLFHSISPADEKFPPSILNLGYDKVIATGSLSKAYSLAGIRVGWIASRTADVIEKCAMSRQYTNISVSQLDDSIATYALDSNVVHNLLGRNISLAKTNLALLADCIDQFRWSCEWTKPIAGTIAFVKFMREGKPVDDVEFCKRLQEKEGVMFVPGCKCFGGGEDFKGYVRIGFVQETEVLRKGLEGLRAFMRDGFSEVPYAK
jgi:aspartate/methionine/tyrosine aminotransferase